MKQRLISFIFIVLYLVFLGNANLYAYTSITESVSSCCSAEEISCCGSCHSEDTSNSDDCCHGNGCCGIVETRLPITIFSSKTEVEQKASVQTLHIKPSLHSYLSLGFSYLLPEKIGSSKIHFFTHSYRCNDRLAKLSIWRC